MNPLTFPHAQLSLRAARRGATGMIAVTATAAMAAAMMMVAAAPAHALDFGDMDLAQAPNFNAGCEAMPQVAGPGGGVNFQRTPPGIGTCTFWQAPPGMVQHPKAQRLTSWPPHSGRITSAQVRTGPNPAPLVFSVVRALSGVGPDGNIIPNSAQNGLGVTQSKMFKLKPNQINRVPLDLPVFVGRGPHSTEINDQIAISAQRDSGRLPLRAVQNYFGSLPSLMSAYPHVSPGAARPDLMQIPGAMLTIKFTMCNDDSIPTGPTGKVRAGSSATGAQQLSIQQQKQARRQACGARVPKKKVKTQRKKQRVVLPVRCLGSCQGVARIKRGKKFVTKKKKFRVGAKGKKALKSKRIGIKLNKRGKRAIRGGKKFKAKLIIKTQGKRMVRKGVQIG